MEPESVGMAFLRSLWEAPQNALGHAAGLARTRSLPRVQYDPEGRREYVYETAEGSTPVTSGHVMLLPPGTTDETLAHERVHTEQSRRYGPLYELLNAIGAATGTTSFGNKDMAHPFEAEAYLRTVPQGDPDAEFWR